jgi:energy-coupling factor transporter ATP-binding protein EcfA2
MHFAAPDAAISSALLIISRAKIRCGSTKVVAVDGPSGSGKTDFANTLAQCLPKAQTLHMDDLYPGWNGLAQAVADLHDQVLTPIAEERQGTYRRWDWEHSRYGEWNGLPATSLLLVEGVGSGAKPGWQFVSTLIWLEADMQKRFRRGIERDGESYLPFWRRWAMHEDALFASDGTRNRAHLVVNTSDDER